MLHLVDLFDDFGSLWAPSGLPEQQKEAQRSSDGSLWGTFLTTFRRKSEGAEGVSISDVFFSIFLMPAAKLKGKLVTTPVSAPPVHFSRKS